MVLKCSFSVLICSMLWGCNTKLSSFIAKGVWDTRKPKVEDVTTIKTWLQNERIDFDEVYATIPENFYTYAYQYSNRGLLFSRQAYIRSVSFKGQQCLKREEKYLLAKKPGVYKSIPDSLPVPVSLNNDQVQWADVEQFLYSLTGEKATLDTAVKSDYYLFLPAARWMGSTLQTSGLRKYIKAARNNPHSTFRIIILNFDKQEWWGKEWCDSINIEI